MHGGTTRDRLALFSSGGVLYVMAVSDVPATTGYGEPVQSLFKFGDGERLVASLLIKPGSAPEGSGEDASDSRGGGTRQRDLFEEAEEVIDLVEEMRPLLVASARGYGFRAAPDLSPTTRSGRRFARVAAGDELVSVEEIRGDTVICLAASGKGLRFELEEVSELSGVGRGVILMRVDAKDRLLGALAVDSDASVEIAIDGGTQRTVPAESFPSIRRGGRGHGVVKRGKPTALRPIVEHD
jgi:DNA gyrase subunit A